MQGVGAVEKGLDAVCWTIFFFFLIYLVAGWCLMLSFSNRKDQLGDLLDSDGEVKMDIQNRSSGDKKKRTQRPLLTMK